MFPNKNPLDLRVQNGGYSLYVGTRRFVRNSKRLAHVFSTYEGEPPPYLTDDTYNGGGMPRALFVYPSAFPKKLYPPIKMELKRVVRGKIFHLFLLHLCIRFCYIKTEFGAVYFLILPDFFLQPVGNSGEKLLLLLFFFYPIPISSMDSPLSDPTSIDSPISLKIDPQLMRKGMLHTKALHTSHKRLLMFHVFRMISYEKCHLLYLTTHLFRKLFGPNTDATIRSA